jgi:hypothetical protein
VKKRSDLLHQAKHLIEAFWNGVVGFLSVTCIAYLENSSLFRAIQSHMALASCSDYAYSCYNLSYGASTAGFGGPNHPQKEQGEYLLRITLS